LSDIHLGYRGCKAEYLLDFLKSTESEVLYLVGDIVDIWSMRRTMYWPQNHNNIIRTILGKAKCGTRIVYVPGNHDEQFRDYSGMVFGNVEIHAEYTHLSASGRRLLVLHGDKFDAVMRCNRLTEFIGSKSYDFLMYLNRHVYRTRKVLGFPYWSLASYLKKRIRNAMRHIHRFEEIVARDAAKRGFDGVICGHIHHAQIRDIDGFLYCNDGDWVENCTALVETRQGELQLLHWSENRHTLYSEVVTGVAA
jgi:UDP-2,3-diacylglucosamine pyrophosphatase LpxH